MSAKLELFGNHHPHLLRITCSLLRAKPSPGVPLSLCRVFEAFEKHCKVDNGYVGMSDVTQVPPAHDETMQSFFVAVRIVVAASFLVSIRLFGGKQLWLLLPCRRP